MLYQQQYDRLTHAKDTQPAGVKEELETVQILQQQQILDRQHHHLNEQNRRLHAENGQLYAQNEQLKVKMTEQQRKMQAEEGKLLNVNAQQPEIMSKIEMDLRQQSLTNKQFQLLLENLQRMRAVGAGKPRTPFQTPEEAASTPNPETQAPERVGRAKSRNLRPKLPPMRT